MSEEQSRKGWRWFCVPGLWAGALAHLSRDSRRVAWAGVLMVPVFWLLDALVDVYVFGATEHFHHGLFEMEPVELYMRILVSIMFVAFGVYAAFMLDRAERMERALRSSNAELAALKEELEMLATVDPLTGTLNRRKFHEELGMAIYNAERHGHHFTLLVFDVDHFKQINDRFGHQAGDQVLREVCDLVELSVRASDRLFRVGGEEFCLLAVASGEDDVRALAEKLRQTVAGHAFQTVGQVTVSIGIARFRLGDTPESIFARADEAMYAAKRKGRNCVMAGD